MHDGYHTGNPLLCDYFNNARLFQLMAFSHDGCPCEFHDEEAFVGVVDLDLAEVAVLQQLLEGQLGGLRFVVVAHSERYVFKLSGKSQGLASRKMEHKEMGNSMTWKRNIWMGHHNLFTNITSLSFLHNPSISPVVIFPSSLSFHFLPLRNFSNK